MAAWRGIICPLPVGGLAATWLSWRFAFVLGAVLVVAVAGSVGLHRRLAVLMVSGLYDASPR
ncbi:MAG TPA: hypothetical protein VFJ19_18460 [Nocardioidaceae bacterium]|nr:hypothetical protein [Nocardioidaceae bacterium]